MIGFVVGYILGTRAGEQGYTELRDAVRSITSSGELKELVSTGVGLLGDVLSQGRNAIGEGEGRIRRVA